MNCQSRQEVLSRSVQQCVVTSNLLQSCRCVTVACSWGGEAAVADESAAATTSTTAGAEDAAEQSAAATASTDTAASIATADTADAATDAASEANGSATDVAAQHTGAAAAAHSDAATVPDADAQPTADDNHTATAATVTKQLPAPGILRLRKLLLRSQDFAERLWRPRKEWTSVEAAIAAQQCRHLSRAVTANGALCRWLPVNTAVYLALLQWREQTAVSILVLL
jgi:hypothetical protein